MSNVPGYENTDPNELARQAEQDLNSHEAKQGHHGPGHAGVGASDSSTLRSLTVELFMFSLACASVTHCGLYLLLGIPSSEHILTQTQPPNQASTLPRRRVS